jgi:hypothetical protein
MPEHLTPEQIDFFSRQTERAVKKALRYHARRAAVAYTLVLAAAAYSVYNVHTTGAAGRDAIVISARNVATDSCNARFRQQEVLRDLIRSGRSAIKQYVAEGTLTPAQGKRALAENARSIERLRLPDCRVVGNIITDDIEDLQPGVPPPLFPGSVGSQSRPLAG